MTLIPNPKIKPILDRYLNDVDFSKLVSSFRALIACKAFTGDEIRQAVLLAEEQVKFIINEYYDNSFTCHKCGKQDNSSDMHECI